MPRNPAGISSRDIRHNSSTLRLQSIREAQVSKIEATLTWRHGRCDLATNRDLPEPDAQRVVCGFNPSIRVDDTLLVGRISDTTGKIVTTIVNYACHPTTLAWENRLHLAGLGQRDAGHRRRHTPARRASFLTGASGELRPPSSMSRRPRSPIGMAVVSVSRC